MNDNRKTILFIMMSLFGGGAEKQYRYIITKVSQKYNVKVLLINTPQKGYENDTEKFIYKYKDSITFFQLNGDVMNHTWRLSVSISKLRSFFLQKKWILKYLKYNNVDVVMFTYVSQLLLAPIFKKYGTKTIFNERNTGRQVCDRKYKINLMKMCDKVIANSKYASDYIEKKTGIKVDVVNNGIEMKEIEKIIHNGFTILVPARITPIKNQMVAISAMKYLPKDVNLILAGRIEDKAYAQMIQKAICNYNLRVSVLGYINNIDELYRKTDIMCLTSYEEGTPNVLLEAYMYEIFPLVSDIPMNRACCADECILFDPDNPRELAKKILYVKEDMRTEEKRKLLSNNKKYLYENYNIERMTATYLDLFDQVKRRDER